MVTFIYPLSKTCKENGEVFTFGFGKFGNLGYKSEQPQMSPKKIEGIPKISQIRAGTWTTFLFQ